MDNRGSGFGPGSFLALASLIGIFAVAIFLIGRVGFLSEAMTAIWEVDSTSERTELFTNAFPVIVFGAIATAFLVTISQLNE